MPGNNYLELTTGQNFVRSAQQTSAGVADANKIVALDPTGRLDASLMPSGFGVSAKIVQASEALAAGDAVNLHDVAGALRMRKADASTANAGRKMDGYVTAAVASGATGTCYFEGENSFASGLTNGSQLFLSATVAGLVTATPPSLAGHLNQPVGRATSATSYVFKPERTVIL
jgi:hypothetical protein